MIPNYWIDGDFIRFQTEEKSGLFSVDYEGPERDAYDAWLAEGNTPEEWPQL